MISKPYVTDTCLICEVDLTPTEILAGEVWCAECKAMMNGGEAGA
jgi:hypothetical protein